MHKENMNQDMNKNNNEHQNQPSENEGFLAGTTGETNSELFYDSLTNEEKSSRGSSFSSMLIVGVVFSAIMIVLDQVLKLWTIENLQGAPSRVFIDGVLRLTYLENRGAAFGFLAGFDGARILFTVVKIVLLLAIVAYYFWLPRDDKRLWAVRIPLAAVFAGGVGNLIDRVRLGFVVDMLAFEFVDFPVFNLADVFVTGGVFILAFVMLFVVKDVPFPL